MSECDGCDELSDQLSELQDRIRELENQKEESLGRIEMLERRINDAVWELQNG